jgi:hypothetical protein
MSINDLKLKYDGICVYATLVVKANTTAKFILSFINLVLVGIVVVFSVEQVLLAALVFFGLELLVIKYTLWNLFGEERLIINAKSLSYQQHYGFFTTTFYTINFNKRITIIPYDEITESDKTYVKFLFESYNENNLPDVIYHSVLNIPEVDFEKLIQQIDRLFMDEMVTSYEMPIIHLN